MSENDIESAANASIANGVPSGGSRRASPWSRVMVLVLILTLAALVVFGGMLWIAGRTLDVVERGVDAGKEAVVGIAEAFRPEVITETFMEFTALRAEGNEGNILEVATAEATESFTRKTNVVWFDREIPIGTTVSEISVPATYRYHIDLSDNWTLSAYDARVTVVAPSPRPSLPVAFDSGRARKKTKSGWARWDGGENLEALERSLTEKLAERAADPVTVDGVRDAARLSVAKFVRNWLLDRDHWHQDAYEEIVVVFEDELEKGEPISELPPTLRLAPAGERQDVVKP